MALGDYPVSGVTAPTVYPVTGFTAIPTSLTSLVSSTIWLSMINITNTTSSVLYFSLTNQAGDKIRTLIGVAPGVDFQESWVFLKCIGLKWSADNVGLVGQVQVN